MKKFTALVAVFGLVFFMTSCSKPEEVTVTKYFQAMSHNDADTMGSMAVEPKNLEYDSYKIIGVSEPLVEEFQLPNLVQMLDDLKKERQKQLNIVRDLQDEIDEFNFEIGETRRRSRKAQLQQQIAEKEEAMKIETDKFRQLVADMGSVKNQIEQERNLVKLSAGIKQSPEIYAGETMTSRVDTNVVFKDGSVADYVFELIKYELKVEDRVLPSRLVILKIQSKEEYEKAKAEAEVPVDVPEEEVTEQAPAQETEAPPVAEGEQK